MNNTEKNTYAREKITEALLNLLKEKPLDKISVKELTTYAGVGRATFYRNYTDLRDILTEHDKNLIAKWSYDFENSPDYSLQTLFGSLFQHYKDHSDFYLLLYKNNLTDTMLHTILNRSGATSEMPNKEAYTKAFFSYGIYGWLMEWMSRGMIESAEDINAMMVFSPNVTN